LSLSLGGVRMREFWRRVERLERREGGDRRRWPPVLVHQLVGMTDAEVEELVCEGVGAEGWTGPVGEYPGRVVILRVAYMDKSALEARRRGPGGASA